jgi:protein phosphatase
MPDADRSRTDLLVTAAGDTDIGRRPHNEDAVLLRPDLGLFVLADGAGGHNAGNVASALATTAVVHFYEQTQAAALNWPEFDGVGLHTGARRLATAIQRANQEIVDIARSSAQKKGMGTTIVALHMVPASRLMHLAHVGDSRCYRIRGGYLEQLTQDHSLLNDVLELNPDIDDAAAMKLPRSVITRALGMSPSVRVSVRSYELVPGDVYILCSDGLTDVLDDSHIADSAALARDPNELVRILLERTRVEGADDNVAIVAVRTDLAPGAIPLSKPAPAKLRVPKRTIAAAARASRPAPRDPDMSDPEIIIVSAGGGDDDSGPFVQVVPALSTTDDVLDAVTDLVESGRSGKRRPPK